jgi:hypothetical protein
MESVGTNPLPRKGSRTSGMGRLLAVSTLLLTWPSATDNQMSAKVTTTRKPAAASHAPRIIVRVIYDLARHAGQADIMREQHDGAIGWQQENVNIPNDYDWPAYVAKLTKLADQFE